MERYTLKEFSEEMQKRIMDYVPDGVQDIFVERRRRPNSDLVPGVDVFSGYSGCTIPLVYMDSFYSRYCNGENVNHILESISSCIDRHRDLFTGDVRPYFRRRKVRKLIVAKLINVQDPERENELRERPCTSYPDTDLGLVYDLVVPDEDCTIPITFDIMKAWSLTPSMLYCYARQNTPLLRPAHIWTMPEVLRTLGGSAGVASDPLKMIMISNEDCNFGAICVLYPQVDSKIKQLIQGDYYLLPADVHQMIAVSRNVSPEVLTEIIASTNYELVCPDEQLGGVPYEYRDGFLYPVAVDTDTLPFV